MTARPVEVAEQPALPPEDGARTRAALVPYVAVRLGLLLLAFAGAFTARQTALTGLDDYVGRWDRWDAVLLRRLAEFGYDGDPSLPPDPGLASLFPGYPLLLRAVHAVVPGWTVAGLLLSLVAGVVVAVSLARLARLDGHPGEVGARAVLYLFCAPYAVFLVAGYTEVVFLALALPAWIAARQRRWVAAGLLAGAASSVRVTGLFLAVALLVQLATSERRPCWSGLALLTPFAVVASYVTYLHARTGDWLAWSHAQERGFGRRATWPWEAFRTTLDAGLSPLQGAEYRFSFFAEIAFVGLGIAVVGWLVARRRWAEAVYVGLSVAALASSTFFYSVSRASLLWWPLYLGLAVWAQRRPWVHTAYLVVALPLLGAITLTYTSGLWAA